jgi:hypothetical protein
MPPPVQNVLGWHDHRAVIGVHTVADVVIGDFVAPRFGHCDGLPRATDDRACRSKKPGTHLQSCQRHRTQQGCCRRCRLKHCRGPAMSVARAVPGCPPRILQGVRNNLSHIECNGGAKSIRDCGGSGFTKPGVTGPQTLTVTCEPGAWGMETVVKRASGLPGNHRRYCSRVIAPPAVGFAAAELPKDLVP